MPLTDTTPITKDTLLSRQSSDDMDGVFGSKGLTVSAPESDPVQIEVDSGNNFAKLIVKKEVEGVGIGIKDPLAALHIRSFDQNLTLLRLENTKNPGVQFFKPSETQPRAEIFYDTTQERLILKSNGVELLNFDGATYSFGSDDPDQTVLEVFNSNDGAVSCLRLKTPANQLAEVCIHNPDVAHQSPDAWFRAREGSLIFQSGIDKAIAFKVNRDGDPLEGNPAVLIDTNGELVGNNGIRVESGDLTVNDGDVSGFTDLNAVHFNLVDETAIGGSGLIVDSVQIKIRANTDENRKIKLNATELELKHSSVIHLAMSGGDSIFLSNANTILRLNGSTDKIVDLSSTSLTLRHNTKLFIDVPVIEFTNGIAPFGSAITVLGDNVTIANSGVPRFRFESKAATVAADQDLSRIEFTQNSPGLLQDRIFNIEVSSDGPWDAVNHPTRVFFRIIGNNDTSGPIKIALTRDRVDIRDILFLPIITNVAKLPSSSTVDPFIFTPSGGPFKIGDILLSDSHIYVRVSDTGNLWKRVALSTF